MDKSQIVELQQRLNQSGFAFSVIGETLREDGVYGVLTDRVYRAYLDLDHKVPTIAPTPVAPWWTNKALLGGLATVLATVLGVFGYGVDSAQLGEVLLALATAVSGGMAIVGAFKAKPVDRGAVLPGVRRGDDGLYRVPPTSQSSDSRGNFAS